jgi:hypothetical protein
LLNVPLCRKHYWSVNCLVTCDHRRRIRHFTCRHAGSAHDSKIWNESALRGVLERQFSLAEPQFLIGDEGYPCTDVLLTVVREAQMNKITDGALKEKSRQYNRTLKKVRIIIEHVFGMVKKRFPALLYELRCKLDTATTVIASAIVLHNILLKFHEEMSPPELPQTISEETFREQMQRLDMENVPLSGRPRQQQFRVRDNVIRKFF